MYESSITEKGQTTVPKPVREVLRVQGGDKIRYIVVNDEVRIMPVRPIARLYGSLQHDGPPATIEQMNEAIADGATEE